MTHLETTSMDIELDSLVNHAQLLLKIDNFACTLNDRLKINIGILDFLKAFDVTPHIWLLKYHRIRVTTLQWIITTTYLTITS